MTHALLDSTLDLLDSLIAFDTRSSESNLALIDFIQQYLKQHDVESSLVLDETGAAEREDVRTLAFGTGGGLFQSIGIPTVVCGPGSIEQGHKADEYVELEQLSTCLSFLGKLSINLAAALPVDRS